MKAVLRPGGGESKPAEGNQVYSCILFSEFCVCDDGDDSIDAKISFYEF